MIEPAGKHARAIKGPKDIRATNCAIQACATAMQRTARPGRSVDESWAILHAESIRLGGEWIESRLLASGLRTDPRFQECGLRISQPGVVLAFDTDLTAPYGMCADLSRTRWIRPGRPRADVNGTCRLAREMLCVAAAISHPGCDFSMNAEDQPLITWTGVENLSGYLWPAPHLSDITHP